MSAAHGRQAQQSGLVTECEVCRSTPGRGDRGGRERRFEGLYAAHYRAIAGCVLRRVDAHEADDVTSQLGVPPRSCRQDDLVTADLAIGLDRYPRGVPQRLKDDVVLTGNAVREQR